MCVSVILYPDYLKKFFTDFDETWQDDVDDKIQVPFEDGLIQFGRTHTSSI